jgi:hypothetical protein
VAQARACRLRRPQGLGLTPVRHPDPLATIDLPTASAVCGHGDEKHRIRAPISWLSPGVMPRQPSRSRDARCPSQSANSRPDSGGSQKIPHCPYNMTTKSLPFVRQQGSNGASHGGKPSFLAHHSSRGNTYCLHAAENGFAPGHPETGHFALHEQIAP